LSEDALVFYLDEKTPWTFTCSSNCSS